jgi:hypothetical protein
VVGYVVMDVDDSGEKMNECIAAELGVSLSRAEGRGISLPLRVEQDDCRIGYT